MFVFGSQYLRGESPRQEDWNRDMANMKKLGFNTIRAWLVWSTVEPGEGQINEDYLSGFMDTAEKNGLQVGFLFHLHGAPAWAVKKYQQYYYVSNRGRVFEPSARANTPGGGWPGLCYDYPEVQEITLDFIGRVVQFLSPQKGITFWEPMNEPHVFYDSSRQEMFCYCEATRAKFRKWLKKKYSSIEGLNTSWGRFHNDWEEIIPTTWDYGFADVIDYRCFLMDNLIEELQRRIGVIKEYDSRPVIAHAWGGGSTICPVMPAMAFDDWKNASIFDKWGYSAFPASYQDNAGIALGTTATRGAAKEKVFWQSELGAGDNGSGIFRIQPAQPEEITSWVWESIAQGAKGLLFWQYRKELYGSEIGGYALTDYDGTPSDRAVAVSQVNRIIQENEALFNDSYPLKAEAAMLYSPTSYMVEWAGKGKDKDNRIAVDSLSGYFRMFWENSLPVDVVHEDFINLDELKVTSQ